tara:strand:+ start:205 stop:396 length:192 start_codon:yes stop_codon:yes gene_type:complete
MQVSSPLREAEGKAPRIAGLAAPGRNGPQEQSAYDWPKVQHQHQCRDSDYLQLGIQVQWSRTK